MNKCLPTLDRELTTDQIIIPPEYNLVNPLDYWGYLLEYASYRSRNISISAVSLKTHIDDGS